MADVAGALRAIFGFDVVTPGGDLSIAPIHHLLDSRQGIQPAERPENRIQAEGEKDRVGAAEYRAVWQREFDFLHAGFACEAGIFCQHVFFLK